eukprot:GHUV01038681.1.p1 GENE.GHUV01038681.1~~GHUV01038681.1.p1  ORF type:complete len:107 (-),score=8.92 GHUV01038681.1:186-506(-)
MHHLWHSRFTSKNGCAAHAVCISGVRQVLPSLLAFDPTVYGLPAFHDLVEGVIPMEPALKLKGTVVKGFGRGSKVCADMALVTCSPNLLHGIISRIQPSTCSLKMQ